MDRITFGVASITLPLFAEICRMLPRYSTILELGSGQTTHAFIRAGYRVISIEHDKTYINHSKAQYVYAPIRRGWYDCEPIHKALACTDYQLLLIDGPPGDIGRLGVLQHLEDLRFSEVKPRVVVVDDIHREPERRILGFMRDLYPHSLEILDAGPPQHDAGICFRS